MTLGLEARAYGHEDAEIWDQLCRDSVNGTFLHTRRFLDIASDRFVDSSVLLWSKGSLLGVIPAAVASEDAAAVTSHPGATYGGIVHVGKIRGERMQTALIAVRDHLSASGYKSLNYRSVPHTYHFQPAEDDDFFLRRLGAKVERATMNCVLNLRNTSEVSKRKSRNLKKAKLLEIRRNDLLNLENFHSILSDNLNRRHGTSPVHGARDLEHLSTKFPDEISLYTALIDSEVIAGTLVFQTPTCWHSQYIASSAAGAGAGAVDLVLTEAINDARTAGAEYFSFGISNDPALDDMNGTHGLNETLHRFKLEFGGGGVVQLQWSWNFSQ